MAMATDAKKVDALGRLLCKILRHDAAKYKLAVRPDGFARGKVSCAAFAAHCVRVALITTEMVF
jgi:RNA:NAD 2'-phosphotransferase (TPT1/KptA family)